MADVLEAGECQGVTDGICEPQPIEHVAARLAVGDTGIDEEIEYPLLDRKPATEDVAMDIPGSPGNVVRIGDERISVIGCDSQLEHQCRPGCPAPMETPLVVGFVEGAKALHFLGELQVVAGSDGGHGATSALATMPSATWSAKAAMVSDGLAPTGPGIAAPSTTYSPG